MPNECLNGSEMPKVLKALDIANKRIDELEKYNLDLANESHNKSLAIERANKRVKELESAIATAIDAFNKYEMDVDTYPTIEHVKMKNGLHDCLNKFAIEKKIEALEKLAYGASYDVVSDACNWEIEQLRKEQSND